MGHACCGTRREYIPVGSTAASLPQTVPHHAWPTSRPRRGGTTRLAKRVSFATFRFGILESTGGLGLDIHLFRDRFELATEVFAISEQQFPRLRARLAVEVVRRFWMIAGIDDALNANRDFFLGLQLRFDDEDLKGILPFVGGLTP